MTLLLELQGHQVNVAEWLLPAIVGPLFGLMLTPLAILRTPKEAATALLILWVMVQFGVRLHAGFVERATPLMGARAAQVAALSIVLPAVLMAFVSRADVVTPLDRVMSGGGAYLFLNLLAQGALIVETWRRRRSRS